MTTRSCSPARATISRRAPRFSVLALLGLARQRQHLSQLDDTILRDIGVTRAEADREAGRPIWDVPQHWLR